MAGASPATTRSSAAGETVTLRDLPPGMAAAIRPQLSRQLLEAVERQQVVQSEVEANRTRYGEQSPEAAASQKEYTRLADVIDGLNVALAEPLPVAVSTAAADPLPRPLSAMLRWTADQVSVVTTFVLVVAGVAAVLLRRPAGGGHTWATGVFGLMVTGGAATVFAAGLSIGIGRPAGEWAVPLAAGAVLTLVSVAVLRHNRRPAAASGSAAAS